MKTRIIILAITTLLCSANSFSQNSVWSGAFQGLANSVNEIARQAAEEERILEIERKKAEIREQAEQRQREREAERQAQAYKIAAEARRAQQAQLNEQERLRKIEERNQGISGSGFFFSQNGELITNAHVISDYKYIAIRNKKDQIIPATILEIDKERDLAILKTDEKQSGLRIAKSSTDLKGEEVYAIGYPMPGVQGQESKITKGIISSLSGFQGNAHLLQTSAPIQSGNSGGPLVDSRGVVVGIIVSTIDTKKLMESSGNFAQNINYAIKVEEIQNFLLKSGVKNIYNKKIQSPLKTVDANTIMVMARDLPFEQTITTTKRQIPDVKSLQKPPEAPPKEIPSTSPKSLETMRHIGSVTRVSPYTPAVFVNLFRTPILDKPIAARSKSGAIKTIQPNQFSYDSATESLTFDRDKTITDFEEGCFVYQ